MSVLGHRLLEVHDAMASARLAHAFGGAIALAYCTEEPRGTRDLDVNVFVDPGRAREVFDALPGAVQTTPADLARAEGEGQVRVWWEDTPIDLFFDVHRFHVHVASEVRWAPFEGRTIPVLGCTALAVFKALFNRTRDWADMEDMIAMGSVDLAEALSWLGGMVGQNDPALARLTSLAG